jgi:hypothetical protein
MELGLQCSHFWWFNCVMGGHADADGRGHIATDHYQQHSHTMPTDWTHAMSSTSLPSSSSTDRSGCSDSSQPPPIYVGWPISRPCPRKIAGSFWSMEEPESPNSSKDSVVDVCAHMRPCIDDFSLLLFRFQSTETSSKKNPLMMNKYVLQALVQ